MAGSSHDDLVLSTLMEIRGDIGGMQADIKQIKEQIADGNVARSKMQEQMSKMSGMPKEVQELEEKFDARIDKLEKDVSGVKTDISDLKTKDLKEISDQLIIHKWLASNRNKVIAAVGAVVLGGVGQVVVGFIKDNVKVSIAKPESTPQPSAAKATAPDEMDAGSAKDAE